MSSKKRGISDDSDDEKNCAICLDPLKTGKTSTICSGLHSFHKECLDEWKKTTRNCPFCRNKITHLVQVPVSVVDPKKFNIHKSAKYDFDRGALMVDNIEEAYIDHLPENYRDNLDVLNALIDAELSPEDYVTHFETMSNAELLQLLDDFREILEYKTSLFNEVQKKTKGKLNFSNNPMFIDPIHSLESIISYIQSAINKKSDVKTAGRKSRRKRPNSRRKSRRNKR